ncbi:O-antigen ligase family protein [Actinopolymorpha alba]|uniref:O-antigen ligase family protein n=1 Tax=Actinopolymorpha alba TaxID=533267 RepID=UPI000379974C|nr:O-antigen ligase family protein [Actinopolymorpha alba]
MTSFAFAAAAALGALGLWWFVPRLRSWPPSLGLLIAVLTVVPPHQAAAFGIGADDVLFVLGLVLLLPHALARGTLDKVPYGRALAVGAGLLAAGATVSAFVNGESLTDTADLLVRGPGRILLYVAMVLVVVAQVPSARTREVVARGLAAVGTFESVVSLLAYFVGLPGGFGLQEAQGNTTLVGEIPGRVTGTLDLSPNFLGALLVLSVPVTLGIALDAASRRLRVGWALAVVVQLAALVLTYTRSSLAVTLLACVVLIALRGRVRWLAVGGVVLAGLLFFTPAFERFTSDSTDRMALYVSAIRVFVDHPIAGVGPGEQARFTAADPERYRATPFGVAGNNAHNTVLLAGAENGVLGLLGAVVLNLALVAVAIAVIRRARAVARASGERRMEPLGIGVAMLAFVSQGMANNLFTVTLTASALVMLVGGCALPWLDAGQRCPDPVGGPEDESAAATGESDRSRAHR